MKEQFYNSKNFYNFFQYNCKEVQFYNFFNSVYSFYLLFFSSIYPAFICINNSRWWKYLRFFSSPIFSTTTTWGELDWEWVSDPTLFWIICRCHICRVWKFLPTEHNLWLQLTQNWLVLLVMITVSWFIIQRHLSSFSHYSVSSLQSHTLPI